MTRRSSPRKEKKKGKPGREEKGVDRRRVEAFRVPSTAFRFRGKTNLQTERHGLRFRLTDPLVIRSRMRRTEMNLREYLTRRYTLLMKKVKKRYMRHQGFHLYVILISLTIVGN